ncbi:efflux RND transporter periplasmic adaptor subunit [Luteolibacter marinus]|uniref:efflux RND transporter periplasmic adaptor subunit n=1 Tax=Luteolibacter marinus TaxID=2776705 RepID=UPI0018675B56|nr:efflux RND transporter periplasmic adaptor subunit [Luteolibacter marinus]
MKPSELFQRLRRSPRAILSVLLPLGLFLLGWWFGLPPAKHDEHDHDAESGQVWTCSMHPQIRQPGPGLCPICNMDLIPLSGGGGGGLREVSVSPESAALLDLRVAPVVREAAEAEVRLFGRIDYDERSMNTITSRVAGRLDRLFVDYTGAPVQKGDHLAEIYSPDLLVAQRELIEGRRAVDGLASGASAVVRDTRRRLLEAAREKLRLLQFTEQQIADIELSRQPQDHLTLYTPQAGIVTSKLASEGQYVKTGDPLFKIADLSTVWLKLEAYESDLQWLRYAQDLSFTVEALPGEVFHGRIAFIDPEIDPLRRVTRVRVNVDNAGLLLKPGMFAAAVARSKTAANGKVIDPSMAGKWVSPMHPEIVKDGPGQCDICGMDLVPAETLGFVTAAGTSGEPLLIPASAVLRTGKRAVVYVRLPDEDGPKFEGRQIVLGPRVGDRFVVAEGLEEGELVVTRGAFKLDSELQIRAKPSMMNPGAGLDEKPANSASKELAGQWSPVPRELGRLLREPSEKEIAALAALVRGIDSSALQDEEAALWKEFSSRLLNELAEAREDVAGNPAAAARGVARAVEEAGRYLGLPYQPEAPPPAEPATAKALKSAIAAYLPVAAALAGDDDGAAAKAAGAMAATLAASPLAEAPDLAALAQELASADGIKPRRASFQRLSDKLIALTREKGLDAVGNAYVVHCPMAFKNQGADWIADKPVVENPYFGDAMFSCGTVTDTLSVEKGGGE